MEIPGSATSFGRPRTERHPRRHPQRPPSRPARLTKAGKLFHDQAAQALDYIVQMTEMTRRLAETARPVLEHRLRPAGADDLGQTAMERRGGPEVESSLTSPEQLIKRISRGERIPFSH